MTTAERAPRQAGPVSLPMYDLPELQGANDAWWRGLAEHIREQGLPASKALDRNAGGSETWEDPGLLLSQTCGYPLMTALRERLQVVATPIYAAPGCRGPLYSSALLVRHDEPASSLESLRGRRAAINGTDSQSGYNTLRALLAPYASEGRFASEVLASGSHRRSLEMVAEDAADFAALDAVTFALLGDVEPALVARVRVLEWTPSAPGLPYVTSAARPPEEVVALRRALRAAAADPALARPLASLRLTGFEVLPASAYDVILEMERMAVAAGYPRVN